jgi:hypothetical protein
VLYILPHNLFTLYKELILLYRFVECEKWRNEFGLDDLVRNFDYVEKPQVFEYYPQYYHKTDKVCSLTPLSVLNTPHIVTGWTARLYRATRQHRSHRFAQDHDWRENAAKLGS